MTAVALRKITTSPPHPAAVVLGPKADAARARFETGYRRVRAPEWLMSVIACVMGLAAFVAVWAAIAKFGGRIPDPLTVGRRRPRSSPTRSTARAPTTRASAGTC